MRTNNRTVRRDISVIEKLCTKCNRLLPAQEFYPNKRMKLGLQTHCRTCMREWHHERPDYVRKKNAAFKAKNPDYARNHQRKTRLGITPNEVSELLIKQNFKCAGCCTEFSDKNREHVDHCHVSMRIRGLLCRSCNVLLGMSKDRVDTLLRLAAYLTDPDHCEEEAEQY